jgi:hypothetical protein
MREFEHEVVEDFIVSFATDRMDSLVTMHLNSVYTFLRSGVFTAMKVQIVGFQIMMPKSRWWVPSSLWTYNFNIMVSVTFIGVQKYAFERFCSYCYPEINP